MEREKIYTTQHLKIIEGIANIFIIFFTSIFFYMIGLISWSVIFVGYFGVEPISKLHAVLVVILLQSAITMFKMRL